MNFFVTAIGTDSGKTLASAILCEALQADYWKPVQAGVPRDTDSVSSLVTNSKSVFHPELYLLKTPASPHAAARKEGIEISLASFKLPQSGNAIIVEGAGGCLVPLNDAELVIDLISHLALPVVVVSNHYLGSINHTLLTLEALQQRNLTVRGLIFNGDTNEETERIILQRSNVPCLLRIKREPLINRDVVSKYASVLKKQLNG